MARQKPSRRDSREFAIRFLEDPTDPVGPGTEEGCLPNTSFKKLQHSRRDVGFWEFQEADPVDTGRDSHRVSGAVLFQTGVDIPEHVGLDQDGGDRRHAEVHALVSMLHIRCRSTFRP